MRYRAHHTHWRGFVQDGSLKGILEMAERSRKNDEWKKPLNLAREFHKLDVSTDEEVDALKLDQWQEDERPDNRDGSGRVVDELAEDNVARFTEVGPLQPERGAESLVPGRDNTSATLRRHHPNTELARAGDVVEDNLDEPRDEEFSESELGERKVDEGTAA